MADIVDINSLFGPRPRASSDLSVDDLASLVKRFNISSCCTMSTIGILLDHAMGNGATRAACKENPALLPVATVNPQCYFGGEGPWMRLGEDGFRMVRFFPTVQGWDVEYAPFVQLVSELKAHRLPVMLDVDRAGLATRFVSSLRDHSVPLILCGVDLDTLAEAISLMRSDHRVFVETSNLLGAGAIASIAKAVGAERILFGSGSPARPVACALKAVELAGLSSSDRALVLGGNARNLLSP